jgi:hypothetical protein
VLIVLGPDGVATISAPLQDAVKAGSLHVLAPVVPVGAVAAMAAATGAPPRYRHLEADARHAK